MFSVTVYSMEHSLVALASELVGLESAQKLIADRMAYIQQVLGGRVQAAAVVKGNSPPEWVTGPAKEAPAVRKVISKAKLDALARAREALATQRKQAAKKARKSA